MREKNAHKSIEVFKIHFKMSFLGLFYEMSFLLIPFLCVIFSTWSFFFFFFLPFLRLQNTKSKWI